MVGIAVGYAMCYTKYKAKGLQLSLHLRTSRELTGFCCDQYVNFELSSVINRRS